MEKFTLYISSLILSESECLVVAISENTDKNCASL